MYVCCCNAVTDTEVDSAIEGGAHTRAAVTKACGAGGDCGACHSMIEQMIEDHIDENGCCHGCCPGAEKPAAERPALVTAEALVRTTRAA